MKKGLLHLIVFVGFNFPIATFGQQSLIDTTLVNEFAQDHSNITRSALEYRQVYKEAQELFKKGKSVNRSHLETKFKANNLLADERTDSASTPYRLFSGSNGIIGKDVILYLDQENRVQRVDIVDFGR